MKGSNFRSPAPISHDKGSQALLEEDAFMKLHGGHGSRAIYLVINAIAAIVPMIGAILSAPVHLFLAAIRYDHPMENQGSAEQSKTRSQLPVKSSRNARLRTPTSQKCTHANTCTDQSGTARRRA